VNRVHAALFPGPQAVLVSAHLMMIFDISAWYETDVSGTLELLGGFVRGVEQQAQESPVRYKQYKETHVHVDEDGSHLVELYQGLDDWSWDLQKTFERYFPSLQRRSAFLTVWGMFENELNKLCDRYKDERRLQRNVSDLRGTGIDRATEYLKKFVGLKLNNSTSPEWKQVTKVRNLRNVIVHRDGSLRRSDGQVRRAVLYIKETKVKLK
jgi:hypothetical protein